MQEQRVEARRGFRDGLCRGQRHAVGRTFDEESRMCSAGRAANRARCSWLRSRPPAAASPRHVRSRVAPCRPKAAECRPAALRWRRVAIIRRMSMARRGADDELDLQDVRVFPLPELENQVEIVAVDPRAKKSGRDGNAHKAPGGLGSFMRPNQLEKTSVPSRAFNCVLTRSNTASALYRRHAGLLDKLNREREAGLGFPFDAAVHLVHLVFLFRLARRRDHCCLGSQCYTHPPVKPGGASCSAWRTRLDARNNHPPRSKTTGAKIFLTLSATPLFILSKDAHLSRTRKNSVSSPRHLLGLVWPKARLFDGQTLQNLGPPRKVRLTVF